MPLSHATREAELLKHGFNAVKEDSARSLHGTETADERTDKRDFSGSVLSSAASASMQWRLFTSSPALFLRFPRFPNFRVPTNNSIVS